MISESINAPNEREGSGESRAVVGNDSAQRPDRAGNEVNSFPF